MIGTMVAKKSQTNQQDFPVQLNKMGKSMQLWHHFLHG
jgi:hypothetical protein